MINFIKIKNLHPFFIKFVTGNSFIPATTPQFEYFYLDIYLFHKFIIEICYKKVLLK